MATVLFSWGGNEKERERIYNVTLNAWPCPQTALQCIHIYQVTIHQKKKYLSSNRNNNIHSRCKKIILKVLRENFEIIFILRTLGLHLYILYSRPAYATQIFGIWKSCFSLKLFWLEENSGLFGNTLIFFKKTKLKRKKQRDFSAQFV